MLLIAFDCQPEINLPWYERLGVELGADEYEEFLAFGE
jgi:hypothetical protein